MKRNIFALLLLLLLAVPVTSFAGVTLPAIPAGTAIDLSAIIQKVLELFWLLVATIVVIIFVTIGLMFLTAQGDPAKIEVARRAVIWGAVGVVVILLSFSVIALIKKSFEPGNTLLPVSCGDSAPACNGVCPVGLTCAIDGLGVCNCL